MYYIPKGNPMHEKLSTTFVRIDGLLEELQNEGFTGYVAMTFAQSSGYIFVRGGQVLTAAEFGEHERRVGKQVKEQLFYLAQQTKGSISVYYLPDDIVTALVGIADGETIYENLTSDFASLEKLIKRLTSERRLYFISLTFDDQADGGGLAYIEGDRVEAVCSAEKGLLTGDEGLRRLIDESEKRLASFSVFRAREHEIPAFDEDEVEISINRLGLQAVPPPSVTEPASTPAEALFPSGSRPAEARTSFTSKPITEEPDNILEVTEVETSSTGAAKKPTPLRPATGANGRATQTAQAMTTAPIAQPAPAPLPETHASTEMAELTTLMSTVIAAVERGMTVAGRGSSFPTALRAGLLAVTEQYPFLDPFAAEFEYHDREIVFVGSAQPLEFANGLTEALRQMVEDLIYSSNGRVRDYIAEELGKVEREHATELRRFNLSNLTERIC
jgi:hypothetical protein